MFPLAERMKLVSESITLAVSAKANAMKKAGIDVVGFGAGEPDFDTPGFIKDAAKVALDKGQTKYTPTPCLPELREAIARKFNVENGLPYKPDQITTGAGGKHCLYMAFMAVLNPGDEVIIPAPYWVSYPEQVKLAGGTCKFVRGQESAGFKISPADLAAAITPKTKVMIINSPNNPGGHAYSPDELKALADVAAKHPHLIVFSDEIYEKLVFDGLKSVSFATLHPDLIERTLTFNCHSKTFAMTGWRIGYIGGPKPAIDAINKLQSQMTSHITSFTQVPAALALSDPARSGKRRADAPAIREARPAYLAAADRVAQYRLRPPAGRVPRFPQRQRVFRQDHRPNPDRRCGEFFRGPVGAQPRCGGSRQRQRIRHPRPPQLRHQHGADRQGNRPDRRVFEEAWMSRKAEVQVVSASAS